MQEAIHTRPSDAGSQAGSQAPAGFGRSATMQSNTREDDKQGAFGRMASLRRKRSRGSTSASGPLGVFSGGQQPRKMSSGLSSRSTKRQSSAPGLQADPVAAGVTDVKADAKDSGSAPGGTAPSAIHFADIQAPNREARQPRPGLNGYLTTIYSERPSPDVSEQPSSNTSEIPPGERDTMRSSSEETSGKSAL